MTSCQLWIDVLLQAKVDVEVCHVDEAGRPEAQKKPSKRQTATPSKKRKREEIEEVIPDSEEERDAEPELDSSQPDPAQPIALDDIGDSADTRASRTPLKRHRRIVEVVITSPIRTPITKQRQRSPEV